MATASILPRDNLSDEAALAVRNMIVDGRLGAGARINEVHLARQLGISRTPLREALSGLEQEGAVTGVARLGWFVRPLTLDEFRQIYPMRALLDPEALRLAGLPAPDRLARLRTLNDRIGHARDADAIIALDDDWHRLLIAGCPNRVLLELIDQFIRRTRRYEIALMREGRNVAAATANHDDIMAALEAGDLAAGCAALRKNLQTGFAPIAAWLAEREETGT
ncbi:MAG TPA: GntR family transcriptional regulator [Allosphingosinicella sp.]|nr:GntR family transcriptional regulator [Allosphingosinicella sp.]